MTTAVSPQNAPSGRSSWGWCRRVLGPGLFTFPVLLLLLPPLDQTRGEARYSQARGRCRYFTAESRTPGFVRPPATLPHQPWSLEEPDPWGTPYQAVLFGDPPAVRIYSCGPDLLSTSYGLDRDDMSLALTRTAIDDFRDQRRREWWIAFGSWLGLWFVGSALLLVEYQPLKIPERVG
ncbi:MAG: hypothetical protein DWH91_12610 [Planctomycetota bacterium]|nr:MAG: hypothetical protein DWH91_12610 [Planctomycetota bacterium]